jgi:hypothetical protein
MVRVSRSRSSRAWPARQSVATSSWGLATIRSEPPVLRVTTPGPCPMEAATPANRMAANRPPAASGIRAARHSPAPKEAAWPASPGAPPPARRRGRLAGVPARARRTFASRTRATNSSASRAARRAATAPLTPARPARPCPRGRGPSAARRRGASSVTPAAFHPTARRGRARPAFCGAPAPAPSTPIAWASTARDSLRFASRTAPVSSSAFQAARPTQIARRFQA